MITIIVAITKKGIIGKKGQLPWHIPEDFKNFKEKTLNNVVVMGLRTYESIGKPLPQRKNIVITGDPSIKIDGADCTLDFNSAIAKAKEYNLEIFIMGGAYTYAQAIPVADRMIISWIKKDYEGNLKFPEWNKDDWEVTDKKDFAEFELVTYLRKKK